MGRSIWVNGVGAIVDGSGKLTGASRIVSVQSPTQLTTAANITAATGATFQVFDPQCTHVRLYQTADGQATYFRVQRNPFVPSATSLVGAGLQFFDNGNSEPPNFPYTTETSQLNNVPPPVGQFLNEYQGRLCVFGIPGAPQSFFYSNQETTTIGVRRIPVTRTERPRRSVTVSTAFGPIRVKISEGPFGPPQIKPEFDECASAARTHGVPVREVIAAALAAVEIS